VIERKLARAPEAYDQGREVLVIARDGAILHGPEFPDKMTGPDFLDRLAATPMARGIEIVKDVPSEYWYDSDWPRTLRAARDAYLQRRFTTGRSGQSDS